MSSNFTTSCDFHSTNPNADGFIFVIRSAGLTRLGTVGGREIGYAGIADSVGIKCDCTTSGRGPDSTGLYTDGANPMLPAINLTPTGIISTSGDTFGAAYVQWDYADRRHH